MWISWIPWARHTKGSSTLHDLLYFHSFPFDGQSIILGFWLMLYFFNKIIGEHTLLLFISLGHSSPGSFFFFPHPDDFHAGTVNSFSCTALYSYSTIQSTVLRLQWGEREQHPLLLSNWDAVERHLHLLQVLGCSSSLASATTWKARSGAVQFYTFIFNITVFYIFNFNATECKYENMILRYEWNLL